VRENETPSPTATVYRPEDARMPSSVAIVWIRDEFDLLIGDFLSKFAAAAVTDGRFLDPHLFTLFVMEI
jgi:hypothetical protein